MRLSRSQLFSSQLSWAACLGAAAPPAARAATALQGAGVCNYYDSDDCELLLTERAAVPSYLKLGSFIRQADKEKGILAVSC